MGSATTITTTTASPTCSQNGAVNQKVCALPKQIVDVDTEDTDNNNVSANNHNGIKSSSASNGNASVDTTKVENDADTVSSEVQEYDYFGFKVGAKLKWANIVGIIVIHAMFLYTFTHNPLLPRWYTYAWGEF